MTRSAKQGFHEHPLDVHASRFKSALSQTIEKTSHKDWFFLWCSIKDDYRTLIGLEGVNVVNSSDENDEEAGDV